MWQHQCCQLTVWKYQDFSVIQILREINFGESRSSKFAFFAISRAVKMQKFIKKITIKSL